MEETIKITIKSKKYIYPKHTKIIDLIDDNEKYNFIAAKVNNRIRELNYSLKENCTIEFISIKDELGADIYENTLRYILAMASYEIDPEASLKLTYYESRSIYGVYLNNYKKLNKDFINALNDKMEEIVERDIPFHKIYILKEDADYFYRRFNQEEKIELLKYRPESKVHFYECDGYHNYMHGLMTPSTGYIKRWNIFPHNKGFIVQYPRSECNGEIPPFESSPKFSKTLDESYHWARLVSTDTVTKINHHVEKSGDVDFINLCEAHHNNMFSELGMIINENIDNIRIICVAGPSSSGKTTFSNRLRTELLSYGIHPVRISLDDYYLPRDQVPPDEDGKPDLESIEALDIDLFNTNMADLIKGKEIRLPHFNFRKGIREEGRSLKINDNDMIIIEGIHALNERLTHDIPKKNKYKIYIAPQEQINLDNHNPVSLTNIRLIRRIVRDYKFRNASPEKTIEMWPKVRKGEFRWIYNTQEDADYIFNSLLFYEHCVLKKDAMKILKEVKKDSPYYIQASRLMKYIKYFVEMDSKWVPCNSLIQEFLGNSCYEEKEE